MLPPDRADAVAGDLLEDCERRAGRDGRLRATWWLLGEVRSLRRAYGRPPTAARRPLGTPGRILASAWSDATLAVRVLGRQPVLVAAAVLPVALAIAANTALFSLADGLLYRELRLVRNADSIVAFDFGPTAYVNMEQLEGAAATVRQSPLLSDTIFTIRRDVFDPDLEIGGTHIVELAASSNFFSTLGVPFDIGRGFLLSDLTAGGPPAVVVGHALWRAALGGDPAVVGVPVDLGGETVRIVGVAPETFDFPGSTNIWSLYDPDGGLSIPGSSRRAPMLPSYARLADGEDVEGLQAQLPSPFRARRLADAVRPSGSTAVAFLFGATGLLLLVSWLQVGALLFSRAAGRTAELSIRLAMGAGRARLLRIFAVEGAVIATLALALGWLATPSFVSAVVGILPPALTSGQQVEPDVRTLVFASAMTAAGLMLLTVLPVDLLRRANPLELLGGAGRGGNRSWSTRRIRSWLLLGQVSVTVLLLYVAGLVAHSFVRVSAFDLGFDPDGVLVWSVPRAVSEGGPIPADPDAREAYMAERRAMQAQQHRRVMSALDLLRASPDISAAAASRYYPVIRAQSSFPLTPSNDPDAVPIQTRTNRVTPTFFETLGTRLVEGETLASPALDGVYDVAVVNETLAAQLRHAGPVIGQRIRTSGATDNRIVGVVADYVDEAPDQPPDPQVFLPTPPERGVSLWMGIVRITGNPDAARARIRAVVEATWRAGMETTFTTMDEELARATVSWRGRALFLLVLAGLCLPLAVAGIFGALSYDLRSRRRELAVRLALGADPAGVRRHIVARALVVVGGGLVARMQSGLEPILGDLS